jgi:sterol desaturase/sphingolipid hydroxylase (fatty acid hydroxylase superfamily)
MFGLFSQHFITMIGIPIGLVLSNASEWVMHKYVLHGLGKVRGSFWSFHWHEHHRACRQNGHFDPDYQRPVVGWHAQGKEALALTAVGAVVLPLAPVAPFFVGTVVYSAWNYYRKHKRAHLDPTWARENLPWHFDHHMGPNQHANWCVTRPWFDDIMGTREPYAGTEREARDLARRAKKKQVQAERPAPPPLTALPASRS